MWSSDPPLREGRLAHSPPRSHRALDPVPATPVELLPARVARARTAQETWGRTPFSERLSYLVRAAKEMLDRREEAIALVEEEIGKVPAEALFNETLGPLDAVKGWARVLRPALRRRKIRLDPLSFPGKRAYLGAGPRGGGGVIPPLDFPGAGPFPLGVPGAALGDPLPPQAPRDGPAPRRVF